MKTGLGTSWKNWSTKSGCTSAKLQLRSHISYVLRLDQTLKLYVPGLYSVRY
jgi:hypothetical protein